MNLHSRRDMNTKTIITNGTSLARALIVVFELPLVSCNSAHTQAPGLNNSEVWWGGGGGA